jgi:hypothetical protein
MTPAVSTLFVSSEFNDFLYAPVGAETNLMPLSVLSALSRMNLDPWAEAAELSELPRGLAVRRLTSLIGQLPLQGWSQADCAPIANRLIDLLPSRDHSSVPLTRQSGGIPHITVSVGVRAFIFAVVALAGFLAAARFEASSRNDHSAPPAYDGRSSPQTVE